VAIIGTGSAAQKHLLAFRKCAHTEVVAVCGTSAQRATAFGKEFGVHVYLSISDMLAQERPDVVTVASLEWEHEQPVLLALQAGSHVLCEKIMAHSLAIGERMVAAAKQAGRTLGVNYNYRFVPAHAIIRDEISRGTFGAPALFSSTMHSYLWNHNIDLVRYFFGDPVEVTAATVDDQSMRPIATANAGKTWTYAAEMIYHPSVALSASFRFHNPDFIATLSGSALVPIDEHFWSFGFFGTKGALTISTATRENLGGTPGLGPVAERLRALAPFSYPESFDLSIRAFVEALRAGKPAPVTGEDGLAAMRLESAIVTAARTARAVAL
jgi:predicted dehydrogenase